VTTANKFSKAIDGKSEEEEDEGKGNRGKYANDERPIRKKKNPKDHKW
jgi:hypothetical protein